VSSTAASPLIVLYSLAVNNFALELGRDLACRGDLRKFSLAISTNSGLINDCCTAVAR
jgi:hypothetical protein